MTPAEIRAIRQSLGLTQEALARKLNVSVHTVYQWETTGKTHRDPPPYLWRLLEHVREHG